MHSYEMFLQNLGSSTQHILKYNFKLLTYCFFVKQEEITPGSQEEFMSLFYRRNKSYNQLLTPRSLVAQNVFSD